MAQGKLKVKAKLPQNTKKKLSKGNAATKRKNCPIAPKKVKLQEAYKLKQMVTKTVNKSAELEIRAMSTNGKNPTLSKAQQAVAAHHKAQ